MTDLTKKEIKNKLKNLKKGMIEDLKIEGEYQKTQMNYNDFCNYVTELSTEILNEYTFENIKKIDIDKETPNEKDVDVFSAVFICSDYAEVSRKVFKEYLKKRLIPLFEIMNNKKLIDFKTNQSKETFAGIYSDDINMDKIENEQAVFFIHYTNKEHLFINEKDSEVVCTTHTFSPIIGILK